MVNADDLFDDLRAAAVARFPTSLLGVDLTDILVVYYYEDPSAPNSRRQAVFHEYLNVFRTLDQWFPNGYLHNDILYLSIGSALQRDFSEKQDELPSPTQLQSVSHSQSLSHAHPHAHPLSHSHSQPHSIPQMASRMYLPSPVATAAAAALPTPHRAIPFPVNDLPLAEKLIAKQAQKSHSFDLSTSPTHSDFTRAAPMRTQSRQDSLQHSSPVPSLAPLHINTLVSPSPKTVQDRMILPILDRSKRNSLPSLEYPRGLSLGGVSVPTAVDDSGNSNFLAVLLLPKNYSLSAGSGRNDHTPELPVTSHKKQISLDDNAVGHARQRRGLETTERDIPDSPASLTEVDQSVVPSLSTALQATPKPILEEQASLARPNPNPNTSGRMKQKPKGAPLMHSATTDKVLPSISVLVVEDNAINQAILGAFLRKHKILYQIAKNGQEAVDKWRLGRFHLVLMDIQLPVKLGIEATKEIRSLEKANNIGVFTESEFADMNQISESEKLDTDLFRLPVIIVALTASLNSLVDKKNALMAGCNDFLTKPVNLVWLQNKITEWGCMQALIDFDGWKSRGKIVQASVPFNKTVESKG